MNRSISISHPADVAAARIEARTVAGDAGLTATAVEAFATAVSEIARNIVDHAAFGHVVLERTARGVRAIAADHGPGIADLEAALTDGFSTAGGLGSGLPGAKRLVDVFEIESTPGSGTTVRIEKLR